MKIPAEKRKPTVLLAWVLSLNAHVSGNHWANSRGLETSSNP